MLGFDGFGAAALADFFFFVFDGGEEFHHALGIFLEIGGFCVDGGFQDRRGHATTSQRRVVAAESVYGGLGDCASRGRKERRKDNAETLSSRRFAEEEGFTTEDTESTEKEDDKSQKLGG